MNERLKHRLVGAVVLTSLAVILVPMVLELPADAGKRTSHAGVGLQTHSRLGAAHPSPERFPSGRSGERDVRSTTQRLSPSVAEENTELDYGNSGGAPAGVPAVDWRPAAETPQGEETQLKGNRRGVTHPKADVVSSTRLSGNSMPVWAVQLGSFSKKSNAVALCDRLQARGYSAFLKTTMASGGGLIRVYVGPEASREGARQLSRALGKETQLKGLVVPYP